MCITLIWFPLYRYPVTVQVLFCVNITTVRLLTDSRDLWYWQCQYHSLPRIVNVNITIDTVVHCMLVIGYRVLHWFTHSCLRKYSHVATLDNPCHLW